MSIRSEITLDYAKHRGYLYSDFEEKASPDGRKRWHPALPVDPYLDWEAHQWLAAPIDDLMLACVRCSELVPYVLWCALVRRKEEFLKAKRPAALPNAWFVIKIGDETVYSGREWEHTKELLWKAFETRWKVPENMEFTV